MRGGDLDKVPQHIVVLDLEGIHAGLFGIGLLQLRDDRAPFVPQGAGLIQRRVTALGDKPAVAGQQGRFSDQLVVQRFDQRVMARQIVDRRLQQVGQTCGCVFMQSLCLGQAGPNGGKVTRPAPVQCKTRQGAVDVGYGVQGCAHCFASGCVVDMEGNCVETVRNSL